MTDYLKKIIPEERLHLNEPMSRHTTFRVGGEAKVLAEIENADELVTLLSYLKKVDEPYFIKGNGSNLLVSDKGYDGVIPELGSRFSSVTVQGEMITAEAGALMSQIAQTACKEGLTGLEFASGIPGTIGGGVVMNAGAYDGELKDVITSVTVLNEDGEFWTLDNRDMEFGYRTSVIRKRPFVVTSVTMRLRKGDPEAISSRMEELNRRRREKQPLEYPSAGSTFKRPEGYFAGKLIMDAGLRGFSIGGAAVSEKHCGFVINRGNATASDVYEVICEVRERVKDRFGVELEPEVIMLGDF